MPKIENDEKNIKIQSIDTTQGLIWKHLLTLFFPILLGTFFQQLYNTVDAIIVGQFLGKEALAAVGGGTSTIINLLVGFFVGIGSGAMVVISQFFGSKNKHAIEYAVHTSVALALIGGVLISVLGFFIAPYALRAISVPSDIYNLSNLYMKTYMIGVLPLIFYNIGSGILRAVGNTKSPLYFLIVGTILNIILDIVFIEVFKWGVAGAAWATVISQMTSMILTLRALMTTTECHKVVLRKIAIHAPILKTMLKIGFPAGFQSVLYGFSNTLIQANINALGTDSVAAWAAFGKIDSINWMILNAYGIALSTFTGQNYGALKYDRLLKGTRQCLTLAGGTVIFISISLYTSAPLIYKLFINDANVIAKGVEIIHLISPFFILFVPIEIFTGALRGAGKTFIPTIFTATGVCLLRTLWLSLVVPYNQTIQMITACYPMSWVITTIMITTYFLRKKWLPKND